MITDLFNLEFYVKPEGEVMISPENAPVKQYEMEDRTFTERFLEIASNRYPQAVEALGKLYLPIKPNLTLYQYRIAHRFIRCNFSIYDLKKDIDSLGSFNIEFVPCPLRGECKLCGIVCNPVFNTNLTGREHEVMKLYFVGLKTEEISDKLCISIDTVLKHKCNSLAKYGHHSLTEFISHAANTKMFETMNK